MVYWHTDSFIDWASYVVLPAWPLSIHRDLISAGLPKLATRVAQYTFAYSIYK